MRREFLLPGCLRGSVAARRLSDLLCGERGSRNYMLDRPEYRVYGYFYDDLSDYWIAFDNRTATLWFDRFKHEKGAREALRDGDDFFAA